MELAGSSKILAEQHWINNRDFERTCSRKVEHCAASQSPEDIRKQQVQISRKQSPTHGKTVSELFSEKDRKQNATCAERSTNQDARYAHRRTENWMLAVLREVRTRRREKCSLYKKFLMCFVCSMHAIHRHTILPEHKPLFSWKMLLAVLWSEGTMGNFSS
jgi:hypothetical protein